MADLPVWSSRNKSDLWILALAGAALFTISLWMPLFPVAIPANWFTSRSQQFFQIQLIYVLYPRLAQGWPGPLVGGGLTHDQVLFMGLVDGIFGCIAGWLVFQMADEWFTRIVYLIGAWLVWVSLLYLFAKASMLG